MNETYSLLIAPFPEEAHSTDSSRGFDLTSIKSQYVIERLNEVFGVFGWSIIGRHEPVANGVLFHGTLQIFQRKEAEPKLLHAIEATGYSDNKKNMGDTYKGATTDCLSKAASRLGIGNDVFKGKVKAGAPEQAQPRPARAQPQPQKPQKAQPQNNASHSFAVASMINEFSKLGVSESEILQVCGAEDLNRINKEHLEVLRNYFAKRRGAHGGAGAGA